MKILLSIAASALTFLFCIYTLSVDTFALDAPHNADNSSETVYCSKCHYSAASPPPWSTATPSEDNTTMNLLCTYCHNAANPMNMGDGYADVNTHSSYKTSFNRGTWVVECRMCHHPHYQPQLRTYPTDTNSYIVSGGTVSAIAVSSATSTVMVSNVLSGAAYTNYLLIPNIAYPNYMYRIVGNGPNSVTVWGKINTTYAGAGKSYVIKNGGMVKNQISTKNGLKNVKYFKKDGKNSFADGDTTIDGVCQVCHTVTTSFNNLGTLESSSHPSSKAGTNCVECHSHSEGFKAECNKCHGYPPLNNTTGGPYGLANNDGGTGPTTPGAHQKHAVTLGYICDTCHTDGMPASPIYDKQIQLGFNLGGTYNGRSLPLANGYSYTAGNVGTTITNTGSMSCTNIYCHSKGQSDTGGPLGAGDYAAPQWAVPSSGQCGTCHNVLTGSTPPTSGSHQKHAGAAASGNYAITCEACHYGFSETSATHVNGKVNVTIDTTQYGSAALSNADGQNVQRGFTSSTCFNTYCHSNGMSVSTGSISSNTSANWGSGTLACNSCHGNPPNYTNGTPKANNHTIHNYTCNNCHYATTTTGTTITNQANHVNKTYDLMPGTGRSFSYTFASPGGSCSTVSCHSNTDTTWGASACLDCHSVSQGNRAAITPQFNGNSHHIQGVSATGSHCYQCHWEANSDGSINSPYHGGSASPGSAVDLVIYGAGTRPDTYTPGATAIQYTADGTRTEIGKINSHCLGCHSAQNDGTKPFGDEKTSKQYAWDGTSVASRYTQTGTTAWGKYTAVSNAAKKNLSKAYSAHGNAAANQEGWNTTTGVDGVISDATGTAAVQCFDCHNSHGSNLTGITTGYTSSTTNGGILKDTAAGKGGYSVTYQPQLGGTSTNKNVYNPGAALCFDCHMTANASTTTPWGYSGTFGATQAIMGYWDTPYFGPGAFGPQQRYAYKQGNNRGGHLGASSALSTTPAGTIGGLCTPCHDPHGASPTLGASEQYAVPLLKGTWMTSPYREDAAAANTTECRGYQNWCGSSTPGYNIDQNTFDNWNWGSAVRITQPVNDFGGLCIQCHPKSGISPDTNNTWTSMDRIHNTVKGWGGYGANANNAVHSYTCSKCHTPHNSRLPRLMATNCLSSSHRGRVPSLGYPGSHSGSGSDVGSGSGSGSFPAGGSGSGSGPPPPDGPGDVSYNYFFGARKCHDDTNSNPWPSNQKWNVKTDWGIPSTPVLIAEPDSICSGSCAVTVQWNPSTNPDGDPVEYYVETDTATGFNSPNLQNTGWVPVTSGTITLSTNTTYYWRVKARDSIHEYASLWSATGIFILSDGIAPPQVTLSSPANGSGFADYYCGGSPTIGFQWNAVPPVAQYYVQVSTDSTFTTVNYSSGWISTASWFAGIAPGATYYWRVQARDAVSYATGPWSSTWSFSVTDWGCKSSCPFVYVWDGEKYQYITDIQGSAIGYSPDYFLAKLVPLYKPVYIILNGLMPDGEGKYSIKLRETLNEISYVDEAKLLVVDYPEGYEIASSTAESTYRHSYVNPFKLYTLKNPRLPISAVDKNGANILALVSNVDGNLAPEELNAFDFYTLDFGVIDPANAKLVIEGWSVYGNEYKTALTKTQPYVEVVDGTGNWVKVKSFGVPAGDMKRMVIDISNLFLSDDHRMRVHTGADSGLAWRIDRLMLDDSAPVPLTVREVSAGYADLHHRGMAPHVGTSFLHRITADDGVLPDNPDAYGYGSFTRYGDVKALLDVTDDMFAIMRHGDEISLTFTGAGVPPLPQGMVRGLVLKADVYYKTFRVDNNVELLPFHGMSNYPYDTSVENYPTDAEHEQYRLNYNTRGYAP